MCEEYVTINFIIIKSKEHIFKELSSSKKE